jgi:O-antigen/teichoic acid export membrane protein
MTQLGALLDALAAPPADGTCYESSAPQEWLGWGLIAGTTTIAAAMVTVALVARSSPPHATARRASTFRRWWSRLPQLLALVLVALLLVIGVATVAPGLRTGYAVQALVLVLALAPLVAVARWRSRTLRHGEPLAYRQHVVVACAQVVALAATVAALVTTVAVVVAYAQATVPVDCSLVSR